MRITYLHRAAFGTASRSRWNGLLAGVAALALMLVSTPAEAESQERGWVSGVVHAGKTRPIDAAQVYAYHLADLRLTKVLTDIAGSFRFDELAAGPYNIIAHKAGFVPVVVQMIRPGNGKRQHLDLQMLDAAPGDVRAGEDYWAIRGRIPSDVLRDIELAELGSQIVPSSSLTLPEGRFSAGLQAMRGIDNDTSMGQSQLSGGRLDVEARLGSLDFDLEGNFWKLEPSSIADEQTGGREGQVNQISLNMAGAGDGHLNFSGSNSRLMSREGGAQQPVDFENYRLTYFQPLRGNASSAFSAQVTSESNFYRRGLIEPVELPGASTTWHIEGSYSKELSDRSMIETGVRYREREIEPLSLAATEALLSSDAQDRMDVFGKGGYRIHPSMLVEYGVYSVLRDGELDLAPQGGIVFQVNRQWQAAARLSGRVSEADPLRASDFMPSRHGSSGACQQGDELCYQVEVSRESKGESVSLGAVHREFGETLRLYFDDDFFDQMQGLYMVPGDRLPEISVAVSRKLSSNVLARLESNIASGGGGTFFGAKQDAYENEVRYLVTSLDTQFQKTSTGVFFAFHRLEQQLNPLHIGDDTISIPALESERLQLRVSQDLDVLLDLPADWALQLNMDVSRGNPEADEDDYRRRVLGGLAVKF